jgi:hypothetical protein
LAEASTIISKQGGDVLSVGTYRQKWGETPIYYLRLRSGDADAIAQALGERGFQVLGVYASGQ